MGYAVSENNSTLPLTFLLVLASDHITGATGKTPTVTISKNGAAFATPAGAVTEISAGWYQVAANTGDASTLGPLLLHATAAACDPCDDTFSVVDYDPTSYAVDAAPAVSPDTVTAANLIAEALEEHLIISAGDSPSAEDTDLGLRRLNRIINDWNAEREAIYTVTLTSYTLTASLSPHTIGPTGTFVVASRPVSIPGINLILNTGSTPYVRIPIRMRDASWWLGQAVPTLTGTIPSACYYDPAWPNGNLYFWPVPTVAYQVAIQTRALLGVLALTSAITLPPGYRDALTLTLAEALAPALGVTVSPQTQMAARRARAQVWRNNRETPTLRTQDAGVPSGGRSGAFNWRTREVS